MGLDGVELVMAWEEEFGISISDAEAGSMLTPRDALNVICLHLGAGPEASRQPCPSLVAFHQVRRELCAQGRNRSEVTPKTQLRGIWPLTHRVEHEVWRRVGLLARALLDRKLPAWTRHEVRTVMRHIIREQTGVGRFSDDAEFVRDLGID